jgi:hypothetical protein
MLMGRGAGYSRLKDDTKFPVEEEDEGEDNDTSWGLERGMKLFEVSAKDDRGSFVHRFPFTIKLS